MKKQSLNSWDDFQIEPATLDKYRAKLNKDFTGHVSDLLFRGQADSIWKLQTSLERVSGEKEFRLSTYYGIISGIQPEIESFTGRSWDIPNLPDYVDETAKARPQVPPLKVYEYMAHLRHHGFPSPLLDWTTSPYIAAYFAFANGHANNDSVAIYAYLEYAGQAKGGWADQPRIDTMGPYVKTHTRHFLQRCQYTICTRPVGDHRAYTPHESAFQRDEREQDLLWKFTIPRRERKTVLRYLDQHNITAFSLFASEDRLMESLAIRAFVFDE